MHPWTNYGHTSMKHGSHIHTLHHQQGPIYSSKEHKIPLMYSNFLFALFSHIVIIMSLYGLRSLYGYPLWGGCMGIQSEQLLSNMMWHHSHGIMARGRPRGVYPIVEDAAAAVAVGDLLANEVCSWFGLAFWRESFTLWYQMLPVGRTLL